MYKPENIHTDNIILTKQVILKNICTCTYVYVFVYMQQQFLKEAMSLKDSKDLEGGRIWREEEKGGKLWLYYNLKN